MILSMKISKIQILNIQKLHTYVCNLYDNTVDAVYNCAIFYQKFFNQNLLNVVIKCTLHGTVFWPKLSVNIQLYNKMNEAKEL